MQRQVLKMQQEFAKYRERIYHLKSSQLLSLALEPKCIRDPVAKARPQVMRRVEEGTKTVFNAPTVTSSVTVLRTVHVHHVTLHHEIMDLETEKAQK